MFLSLLTMNNIPLYYTEEETRGYLLKCDTAFKAVSAASLDSDKILLDAYSSATIEGAVTTIENVKRALSEGRGTKSDKMVVNTLKTLNKVYNGYIINNDTIRELWECLTEGVCENTDAKGVLYRCAEVYVGNFCGDVIHVPPKHYVVSKYMQSLYRFIDDKNIHPIIRGIICHFYFVYVHPFCDGNGRMARVFQNAIMYQNGIDIVKRINLSGAINNHLGKYYKVLSQCEKPVIRDEKVVLDITPFICYMFDCIFEACDLAVQKEVKLNEEELLILRKMSKHGIGSNISVKACSRLLKCTESHSRYVLNKLVSNKFLLKHKNEKGKNIYVLRILIK